MAFAAGRHTGRHTPQWMAADAKRRVEKSRLINNQIFAYYRVRPGRASKRKPHPSSFERQQEILARIAPWLPKHVPHWMRPA